MDKNIEPSINRDTLRMSQEQKQNDASKINRILSNHCLDGLVFSKR